MSVDLHSTELNRAQFEQISRRVYDVCAINLQPGKEGLVKSRLVKRLRTLNLTSFDGYLQYVDNDRSGRELAIMIDVLTTNKTNFFREPQHFDFLCENILPKLKSTEGERRIRIWSAGCSYGKEPYTIAMLMREQIPDIDRCDARILATDISARVLERARAGVYDEEEDVTEEVAPRMLQKYFTSTRANQTRAYQVNDKLKSMIRFARLNLMDAWPMKGPFDVIFCRNVMIYFDKATQRELVHRFWELLAPGGHLFVGHSESLTASSREFKYVQPAVYVK